MMVLNTKNNERLGECYMIIEIKVIQSVIVGDLDLSGRRIF